MRILFCTGVFPPAIGGPGAVLTKLIPGLVERGFICTVATFGPDDNITRNYAVKRVPLSTPQPRRLLSVLAQIWRLARQHDLIYATDTYTHGLAAWLACKFQRKPFILRFTGDAAWESAFNQGVTEDYIVPFQTKWYGPKIAFRKWLRKQILKHADKIITDCEFLKNLVGIIGVDKNKVTV
ncbi:MAG: glycosyltransferase family 4 protein, partial [Candidatus Komeilibacteria bacterium]|nr:glycosyltransferase family 4 protein [Candidatus Komeilibacteria bacterium]